VIRLFTTIYPEQDNQRLSEYSKCLELNSACGSIDEIYILSEGGEKILPVNDKFKIYRVSNRPTYQDYFNLISQLANDDDISIVSNTDIFFSDHLKFFTHWLMPKDTVFALSRWDYKRNVSPRLYDHNDSQDTWILRGIPRGIDGDFPVGVPRCDNRIASEFEKAGYCVLNPSFSLRCYHIHDRLTGPYLDSGHSVKIPPPYKYVWPHNLFGLWRTLLHNLIHPDSQLYWRFDRRKFAQWLPVRILMKIPKILSARG